MDLLPIFILIFFILALAVRLVSCLSSFGWFSRGFAGDSSVHLQIIKQIKKGGAHRGIENYVIPNKMTYPILFHRICAFFPIKFIEKFSFVPNLLIYVLSFALFVFFTFKFLELREFEFSPFILPTCLLLHLLSIQNLVSAGPAIAYLKLSSRLLAKIGCSLFAFFIFIYLEFDQEFCFFIASFFAAVGFLSGTFAAQFLFFFTLFFSILCPQFDVFSSCLLGLVFSLLVSKGYSFRSIVGMIKYWKIYFLRVRKSRYTAPVLSSFINIPDLIKSISSKRFKLLAKQLYKREPTRAILYYPETLLIFYLLFFGENEFLYLGKIYLAVTIVFFLTCSKTLNFLGEAYRYLEYGLFYLNPFALSLLIGINFTTGSALILVTILIAYSLCISILINRLWGHTYGAGEDNLSAFLSHLNLSSNDVVFPVSMRLGADIVARTECRSFWWQPGGITDLDMYDDYLHEYPYLSLNWEKLCDRHGVSFIVVDKAAQVKFLDRYNFSSLKAFLEDESYIAYKYS